MRLVLLSDGMAAHDNPSMKIQVPNPRSVQVFQARHAEWRAGREGAESTGRTLFARTAEYHRRAAKLLARETDTPDLLTPIIENEPTQVNKVKPNHELALLLIKAIENCREEQVKTLFDNGAYLYNDLETFLRLEDLPKALIEKGGSIYQNSIPITNLLHIVMLHKDQGFRRKMIDLLTSPGYYGAEDLSNRKESFRGYMNRDINSWELALRINDLETLELFFNRYPNPENNAVQLLNYLVSLGDNDHTFSEVETGDGREGIEKIARSEAIEMILARISDRKLAELFQDAKYPDFFVRLADIDLLEQLESRIGIEPFNYRIIESSSSKTAFNTALEVLKRREKAVNKKGGIPELTEDEVDSFYEKNLQILDWVITKLDHKKLLEATDRSGSFVSCLLLYPETLKVFYDGSIKDMVKDLSTLSFFAGLENYIGQGFEINEDSLVEAIKALPSSQLSDAGLQKSDIEWYGGSQVLKRCGPISLLYSLLVFSHNDAAKALIERIGDKNLREIKEELFKQILAVSKDKRITAQLKSIKTP